MFFANAMPMTRRDQMISHEGMRMDDRMKLSCDICAGTLHTMMPRLNHVFSQLRSLPYRLRSACIPLMKALPVCAYQFHSFQAQLRQDGYRHVL